MSKYNERYNQIKYFLKAFEIEHNSQFNNDITATLHQSVNDTILLVCRNYLKQKNVSSEIRKYLIGKMYRANFLMNNQKYFCNSSFSADFSEYKLQKYQYISEDIGEEYKISGSSVIKYDLYARSIDILAVGKTVSVQDILSGKLKISVENVIRLSKMQDEDIEYLKILFGKNFHKLAGYINPILKDSRDMPIIRTKETALIKQMPKHDPDAMITSLTFTIPSWITYMQKTISTSDVLLITDNAKNNLKKQLIDLKNIVTQILLILEDEEDE